MGHWADTVVAAARAGDPYAYGGQAAIHAQEHLTRRITAAPHVEHVVTQQLADLTAAIDHVRALTPKVTPRPPVPQPAIHVQHRLYEQLVHQMTLGGPTLRM